MSVNSKMTAIADEIRTLSGATDTMGLDDMATNIENANTEVDNQAELLAQVISALEGKAAGGGSEPVLQEKTVSPSTSAQSVIPDSGYDGLSSVTVNAMPTATQATPSITVNSSGLITASATQTAGYVSAGTKSNTEQLTTQAAKTITPNTSTQTAVASGVYTTGAITVNPIPSNYIVPSGTKTITTNGTHDVKSYASATVNVAGEDVTTETTAYTTKLATLETAITALETELQGKASGGGSGSGGSVVSADGWINILDFPHFLINDGDITQFCINIDNSAPISIASPISIACIEVEKGSPISWDTMIDYCAVGIDQNLEDTSGWGTAYCHGVSLRGVDYLNDPEELHEYIVIAEISTFILEDRDVYILPIYLNW